LALDGVVHASKPLGKLALFDLIEEYNCLAPEELRMKNLKCFTVGEVDKQPIESYNPGPRRFRVALVGWKLNSQRIKTSVYLSAY
jgi:hypothetical protein